MNELLGVISGLIRSEQASGLIELGAGDGRLRARFYELGDVLHEEFTDAGTVRLAVRLPRRELERLYRHEGLVAELQPAANEDLSIGVAAH